MVAHACDLSVKRLIQEDSMTNWTTSLAYMVRSRSATSPVSTQQGESDWGITFKIVPCLPHVPAHTCAHTYIHAKESNVCKPYVT